MLHSMKFLLHFRKCYNGQIQCFNDSQENYWLLFCCLLESWYCLPDSRLLHVWNPETTSRVTLASLGTVFQTATYFMFVVPRLRPGLLSLRSVLSSRQTDWTKKKYQ